MTTAEPGSWGMAVRADALDPPRGPTTILVTVDRVYRRVLVEVNRADQPAVFVSLSASDAEELPDALQTSDATNLPATGALLDSRRLILRPGALGVELSVLAGRTSLGRWLIRAEVVPGLIFGVRTATDVIRGWSR